MSSVTRAIDWATVDLDAPWQPWTPQVGDRVRVRLSGECRRENDPNSPLSGAGVLEGHTLLRHGMTGTVDRLCRHSDCVRYGHVYTVILDEPIRLGDDEYRADCFAAAELEPLEPER